MLSAWFQFLIVFSDVNQRSELNVPVAADADVVKWAEHYANIPTVRSMTVGEAVAALQLHTDAVILRVNRLRQATNAMEDGKFLP